VGHVTTGSICRVGIPNMQMKTMERRHVAGSLERELKTMMHHILQIPDESLGNSGTIKESARCYSAKGFERQAIVSGLP